MIHKYKKKILIAFVVICLSITNNLSAQQQKKPNVVFIIADQWSTRVADGSGNYGNGIQTPNLTRLADEGMRFVNSYSAFALSCPARASFYTGLMPHNHKVTDNEEIYKIKTGELPTRDDVTTMGEEFKKAGYETAFFGKEHAAEYGWRGIDNFGSMKYIILCKSDEWH